MINKNWRILPNECATVAVQSVQSGDTFTVENVGTPQHALLKFTYPEIDLDALKAVSIKEKNIVNSAGLQEVIDSGLYNTIYIDQDITLDETVTVPSNMSIVGLGGIISTELNTAFQCIGTLGDQIENIDNTNYTYLTGQNTVYSSSSFDESLVQGDYLFLRGTQNLFEVSDGTSDTWTASQELEYRLGTGTASTVDAALYAGGIYQINQNNSTSLEVTPYFDWYMKGIVAYKLTPVENVHFINLVINVTAPSVSNIGDGAILFNYSINCSIENCDICVYTGRAVTPKLSRNIQIVNNICKCVIDTPADHFYNNLIATNGCLDITIADNSILNGTQCVDITYYTSSTLGNIASGNTFIKNNNICDTYTGITTHPGTYNVQILNNFINSKVAGADGIASRSINATIIGNTIDIGYIYDSSAPSTVQQLNNYGIAFAEGWGARRFVCTNNTIQNTLMGLYINESVSNTRNCSYPSRLDGILSNNILYNVWKPFRIDKVTNSSTSNVDANVKFTNNTCHFIKTWNSGAQQTGILSVTNMVTTTLLTNTSINNIEVSNNTFYGGNPSISTASWYIYQLYSCCKLNNLLWQNNNIYGIGSFIIGNSASNSADQAINGIMFNNTYNGFTVVEGNVSNFMHYRTGGTETQLPAAPELGQVYYNSTDEAAVIYTGNQEWESLATTGFVQQEISPIIDQLAPEQLLLKYIDDEESPTIDLEADISVIPNYLNIGYTDELNDSQASLKLTPNSDINEALQISTRSSGISSTDYLVTKGYVDNAIAEAIANLNN